MAGTPNSDYATAQATYGYGALNTPTSPGLAGPGPAKPNPLAALNVSSTEAHNWHSIGHSNPLFWLTALAVLFVIYLGFGFDTDFGANLGPLKAKLGFGIKG